MSELSDSQNNNTVHCSFVSVHYIICECGETFPNEDVLKTHLETEHPHKTEKREYTCGLCNQTFKTEEACLWHHKKSHTVKIIRPPSLPPVKFIIQPIKKVIAADDVSGKVGCMRVTSGKHPGTRKKRSVKKNPKNKICEVCGKNYTSSAALRYHQRVHTGEKPYQCMFCEKAFTMPLFLQIHHRIHTGEKPYQCPHCPKAFGNKAALVRHDRVHTGVKPYQCPQCLKSFSQSNSMKLHVHTVHLKLPTPYKSRRRRRTSPLIEFKEEPGSPKAVSIDNSPKRVTVSRGLEQVVVKMGPNRIGSSSGAEKVLTRGPNRIVYDSHGRSAGIVVSRGAKMVVPETVDVDITPLSEGVEDSWEMNEQVAEFKEEPGIPEALSIDNSPKRVTVSRGLEQVVVKMGPNRIGSSSGAEKVLTRGPNRIVYDRHGRSAGIVVSRGAKMVVPETVDVDITPLSEGVEDSWEMNEQVAEFKEEPGIPEAVSIDNSPKRVTVSRGLEQVVVKMGPNRIGSSSGAEKVLTQGPNRIVYDRHGRSAGIVVSRGDKMVVPETVDEDITPLSEGVEESWEMNEQVAGEGLDMCEVKLEDQTVFADDQSIYYDHETSQDVLYEVVYEQE